MTENEAVAVVELILRLKPAMEEHIHPLLSQLPPEIQSAAVADLAALYLAGVAPQQRETFRQMLFDLIDSLIPLNEQLLFGEAGHPAMRN